MSKYCKLALANSTVSIIRIPHQKSHHRVNTFQISDFVRRRLPI